jgi:autotransporter-associated beta strand protein
MLVGGILSGSTGSVGLTKTGASTLTLANVNTYTGNTSVQNGTLVLRGGDDNRLATTSAVVLGNNAALPAATIGTLQLGDSNGASNQTLTSLTRSGANTSAVVGGHSSVSTLTINTSGGVTFDGVLGGGGTNQNNLALTKEGSGTLSLTGNNTYTGTTHIKEGTISGVAGNNRISTGSLLLGDSASNTSGVLVIGNTGSARSQTVSSITTAGTGTGNRVVGAHGTNSTLTVNNSTTVTYDGFLGGTGTNQNNLNLIKSGSGTLVLTQANSYVGNTTINAGGILRVGNNSAFGTTGSVTLTGTGAILELADGITINRGLTVANAGDNKIIQLQDGATSGEYSGAITINEALINDFDLLAFAGGTLTVSGQIGASAGANITKEGAGTVVVSGDNSAFNKSVSIHAGILRAGNSNAFGSTGGITLANTDTALELANGVTINRGLTINQLGDKKTLALQDGAAAAEYSGGILIKESTHGNVEVSVGNAGTLTISGAVTSEQAAGLTKTGAGTLILSSTLNAYTGNTTISGGKLVVTESIATSTVIVGGSGAILASDTTATIGSTLAVNNGAILAIGDAANATTATATVLGATTFNNGSIFSWDINAAGTSYDKLVTTNVLGQASPAGDAVFRIVVADTGFVNNFWASNQTWSDVFTTDGTAAIANWADVFGSAVSVVNSSFATFTPAAGTFSITGSSLTWTAVPEPTGTLAGLLITAGLIRRRRA